VRISGGEATITELLQEFAKHLQKCVWPESARTIAFTDKPMEGIISELTREKGAVTVTASTSRVAQNMVDLEDKKTGY